MEEKKKKFSDLGLSKEILSVLDKMKFITPTPIQEQSIPVVLEGKDVMGIAQTGTGKTMAFSLPLIQHMFLGGGQTLILVPTRELALQIDEAIEPLLKPFKMKSAVLIGGIKMSMQLWDLEANPNVIIATPGRMNDYIYQGTLKLSGIEYVVLDEADRMLDMGFEPQVNSVLRCVRNVKQTLLFSATMPDDLVKLCNGYMKDPVKIQIARSGATTKRISQELFIVRENEKKQVLKMLLKEYKGTVLVFARTKLKASRVTQDIRSLGLKVAEIHSDRSMIQRNDAIVGFKKGRFRVLVATDVASRGIDVDDIELVVNYDLPDDAENFVHRIGRTGRAGKEGHAITIATPHEAQDIKQIETLTKTEIPRTKHPEFSKGVFGSAKRSPKKYSTERRSASSFHTDSKSKTSRPRNRPSSSSS